MITPEMSIAEVMRMDPEVAPVFMSYGMHCLYCPHASLESIAEASLVHGIDATALDRKSTRLNSSHVRTSRMPSSA